MSQANSTKSTLDAEEHEKDLEEQRKKRKESTKDFMVTSEEAERRKKSVTPPDLQTKKDDCPCGAK